MVVPAFLAGWGPVQVCGLYVAGGRGRACVDCQSTHQAVPGGEYTVGFPACLMVASPFAANSSSAGSTVSSSSPCLVASSLFNSV